MLKRLLGETAIYGLSSILGRTLNYLLVPLYTSVFLPAEYGIVTELYAYVAFLNIIFSYGMETAFFRFASREGGQTDRYFHLCQTALLLSTTLFGIGLFAASPALAELLSYENELVYLHWLIAVLCLDALVVIPFAKLRLEGRAVTFAVFKLSNIGLNIGLNLFFLALCPRIISSPGSPFYAFVQRLYDPSLGVGYVFLSNLAANAFYLLFFIPDWQRLRIKISGRQFKPVLKYALPLVVLGFAGVANEMLSRSMLRFRLPHGFYADQSNLAALGTFGAVYKLSIFMTLVIQAFKYAYEPFFFSRSKHPDAPKLTATVMNGFIVFMCFGWLGLTLMLPEIAPVFLRQPEYLRGLDVVPLLLGGAVFLGIFYNLSVWYKLTDRNGYGASITAAGAVLMFALNWFLIPRFGYMGSAAATILTYFLMAAASLTIGQTFYFVPYKTGKGLTYISVTTVFVLLLTFAPLGVFHRYILGTIMLSILGILAMRMEKLRLIPQVHKSLSNASEVPPSAYKKQHL